MLRRLGCNGRQLGRACADGPQTGLHTGYDEAAQKLPLCRDNIVGRGGAQIDCHAGQGIVCSGSGGIGIEAISRGARHAYFVENGREPAKCIAENLHFTKFEDRATLLKQDVVSALSSIHEKEADVIFMDPPYQSGLEEPVLAALSRMPYVTDETLIVIEATLDRDFSFAEEYGFSIKKEKCYKTNKHVFLEPAGRKEIC